MNNNLTNLNTERKKGEKIIQCFAATYILQKAIYGEQSVPKEMDNVVNQIYDQTKTEQGALLMFLYALLVIPKELIDIEEYKNKYAYINDWIKQSNISEAENTTYKYDKPLINYVRHIRNAVSHGNVEFEEGKYVIFKDNSPDGKQSCQFKIALGNNITEVIDKLRAVIADYTYNVYNSYFTNNKEDTPNA